MRYIFSVVIHVSPTFIAVAMTVDMYRRIFVPLLIFFWMSTLGEDVYASTKLSQYLYNTNDKNNHASIDSMQVHEAGLVDTLFFYQWVVPRG